MEPNTPSGATVNFKGQEIRGAKDAFMPSVYFDFNLLLSLMQTTKDWPL